MIESIHFRNFRVLRDTTLPLAGVTVIVGPNGSGKTTVLNALKGWRDPGAFRYDELLSVGAEASAAPPVAVEVKWGSGRFDLSGIQWNSDNTVEWTIQSEEKSPQQAQQEVQRQMARVRVYALDPFKIAAPVTLERNTELDETGGGLARVLTVIQDQYPERWDTLNYEVRRWFPGFDRVLLDTLGAGQRSFLLRTLEGHHLISANHLSQGTLLAMTMLTLAHLPNPPLLIGLEEPDRGIHPRLLRDVQDALYRLSNPQDHGDDRPAVQVIVTTHSPYFIDLFRDHPEEIVIAERMGLEAQFERLVDQPNVEEILRDAHLGEAWYSGVLGGVPTSP